MVGEIESGTATMTYKYLAWLALLHAISATTASPPTLSSIHYTISRRSGSFPAPDTANLTYLLEELSAVEGRYNATTREFNGNAVVRMPKRLRGTQANTILLGDVGRQGNWFADLRLGEPEQTVNADLDMLTADWYVFSTHGEKGSWFLDFHSKSYGKSNAFLLRCRRLKNYT